MTDFVTWLGNTPFSLMLATHGWMVPAIQSVHILAIAMLTASVVLVDLRLLRTPNGDQGIAATVRRFAPWTRGALVILLLTGGLLIISEPNRELTNWLFWTKMALIVVAILVTTAFQRVVRANAGGWDAGEHRSGAITFALLSLTLWTAIIISGRWIAYVQVQ